MTYDITLSHLDDIPFMNLSLKVASAKCRQFRSGLNMLTPKYAYSVVPYSILVVSTLSYSLGCKDTLRADQHGGSFVIGIF